MPPTSKTLTYHTLDVFTTTLLGGNPLAVIHVPSHLGSSVSQSTRQLLAREFNYSETVVLELPDEQGSSTANDAEVPTFNVQIFLTDREIPFAGHPVIGTGVHLFNRILPSGASKVNLRTKAGLVELSLSQETGMVSARIPLDGHRHGFPTTTKGWSFGTNEVLKQQKALTESDVLDVRIMSIVKGMSFVNVQLKDLDALGRVGTFTPSLTSDGLDEGWDVGILMMMYYVDLGEEQGTKKLRTRMMEGTLEDPATGSASAGLACYLCIRNGMKEDGSRRFAMTQGVEMGRRSEIGVTVGIERSRLSSVELSGNAVEVMEGQVRHNMKLPQLVLLGDSITERADETLQIQLTEAYRGRLEIVNRGVGGMNALGGLELVERIFTHATKPDESSTVKLAVIFFGANDATIPEKNYGQVPLPEFKAALRTMATLPVFTASGTRVILVTPPPINEHQLYQETWGDPWDAARTRQYAAAVREVATALDISVVDLYRAFMHYAEVYENDTDQAAQVGSLKAPRCTKLEQLFCDGLHLSDQGYSLVFRELMGVIERDLGDWLPDAM